MDPARVLSVLAVSCLRGIFAAMVICPLTAQAQSITNNFYAAQRLDAGGAGFVLSADLNGDGKPDLVVLAFGVPTIGQVTAEVWINKGNLAFTQSQQILVNSTTTLALADVNADGIPDLMYGDPARNDVLDVAFGTGKGTFAAPAGYTGPNAAATQSPVIVADFNGDGKPDIAWSRNGLQNGGSQVVIFLNNGSGVFRSGGSLLAGAEPSALATGDLNGDGIEDLVVNNTEFKGGIRIFYGNTSGTLVTGPAISFTEPSAVAVGDVNHDGHPDIVVGSITDSFLHHGVTLLTNRGDGTFASKLVRNFLGPINSLSLLDLNRDGNLELVLAEANFGPPLSDGSFDQSYLAVYSGNGDGTFQAPRTYNVDSDPVNVIASDLYGDGQPALITANANSRNLSVLRSDGLGFFAAAPITLSPHAQGIVTADFNHDGNMDVAVVNDPTCKAPCNGTVTVFFGTGHGWFDAGRTYSIGMHGNAITMGDVNGDGVADLVVINNTAGDLNDVSVLLGKTDGTFQPAHNLSLGVLGSDVFLADMNGDKKLDLVTADGVALGAGTGTFGALHPYTALGAARIDHFAVGDFNHDGKMDIAAANALNGGNDSLSILLGDGTGHFTLIQTHDLATQVKSIAVGNLNSDGRTDLVLSYAGENQIITGRIGVFLGKGDGTFPGASNSPAGDSTYPIESPGWAVVVADLNNDGKDDVAVSAGSRANPGMRNDLIVLPGKGDGTLAPARAYVLLSGRDSRIAVADFTNDGRKDLIVTNDLGISRLTNIGAVIKP